MANNTLPHSWNINAWPTDVYPGSRDKGRYLVRAQRDSLVREGALVRVGRELVIIGDRYARWLQKGAARVTAFECPANRSRGEAA